ncbi:MAG: hypothetical protein ACTIA5_13645, partial [Brachybacterium tyrofermentans]
SVRRILAKVMHQPAERARHLAETGFADAYVEAFHTIFGIDISSGRGAADVEPDPADAAPAGWMRVDRTVPPVFGTTIAGAGAGAGAGAALGAGVGAAVGDAVGQGGRSADPGPAGVSVSTLARAALREGQCPVDHAPADSGSAPAGRSRRDA